MSTDTYPPPDPQTDPSAVVLVQSIGAGLPDGELGQVLLAPGGFGLFIHDGTNWIHVGPTFQFEPFVLADLVWVNQELATADDSRGGVTVRRTVGSREIVTGLVDPAYPNITEDGYAYEAYVTPLVSPVNERAVGLIMNAEMADTTQVILFFGQSIQLDLDGNEEIVFLGARFDNPVSGNATKTQIFKRPLGAFMPMWLKADILLSGVIECSYSLNGVDFVYCGLINQDTHGYASTGGFGFWTGNGVTSGISMTVLGFKGYSY